MIAFASVTIEPTLTTAVVGIIVAAVPTIIGGLLIRSIRNVDTTIKELRDQVEALNARERDTLASLVELRVRVRNLERGPFPRAARGGVS